MKRAGRRTCYDILGVDLTADDGDVRRAYLEMAARWHPDRYQERRQKQQAQKIFQTITHAYNMLRTAERRQSYNRHLLDIIQARKAARLQRHRQKQLTANQNRRIFSAAREIFWPLRTPQGIREASHG